MKSTVEKQKSKIMKTKSLLLTVTFILISIISCDEPETVVTNYVHEDGSVTREIIMRSNKKDFKASDIKVPFDSTWVIKDSCEVNQKGDTTWVKRAAKTFINCDEINLAYQNDSGMNKSVGREAKFSKSFRWFNTVYRFSESVDKTLSFGYPLKDFLSPEELLFFYSPWAEQEARKNGPDSLKYRAVNDTISHKTDKWMIRSLISEWIYEFSDLAAGKEGIDSAVDSLKNNEDVLVTLVSEFENNFDSLWAAGAILNPVIGENGYQKFKVEADSAMKIVTDYIMPDFSNYSVRISMPGILTGSNGYTDSTNVLLWPVSSDFFFTEPYVMWAESKIPNTWAWIVSALFLVFVSTGVVIRVIKKKGRTTSLP
jgi:hypothetical protein